MSELTKPAAKSKFSTRSITTLGLLTALAYATMVMCKVIPPVLGILSFDLKDTVMAIGGFLFGPLAALCMAILVPLIELITVSDTGPYGLIMNIVATCLFVLPAVVIYRRKRDTKHAVMGLVIGVICLTAGMMAWNYIITPMYFKMPRSAVLDMMPVITAFNLVKGLCNSALTMLLYPPVSTALRRARLAPPSAHSATGGQKPKFNYVPMIVSAVALITGVLFLLALLGII